MYKLYKIHLVRCRTDADELGLMLQYFSSSPSQSEVVDTIIFDEKEITSCLLYEDIIKLVVDKVNNSVKKVSEEF